MRIRAVVLAIVAIMLAGCSGWTSEQPLIPPGERDPAGLSGTYQSKTGSVRIIPLADNLYLAQDADPDPNAEDAEQAPTEVAFDLLRSRFRPDEFGEDDPVRDYLLQVRQVDELDEVQYFYTIVTVHGPAETPAWSFTSFDMLCANATLAFAIREEDGFCVFDDYRKLRAAALDALAWHDDARMEISGTKYNLVEPLAP